MRKRQIIAALLAVIFAILFGVNLLGWNLYLYTDLGDKELVTAVSGGLFHNAINRDSIVGEFYSTEGKTFDPSLLLPDTKIITDRGPFVCFATRTGMDNPFAFRYFGLRRDHDYRGFEFPWLLFGLIPTILLFSGLKRHRSPKDDQVT